MVMESMRQVDIGFTRMELKLQREMHLDTAKRFPSIVLRAQHATMLFR